MIQNTPEKEKIDTDAKAILKGMGLQEARIINRLLQAVLEGRENVFFAMEYIDDISEMDFNGKKVNYATEQDKEYGVNFSVNSEEIKKSLRIFFDNWRSIYEASESIRFLFYTNASIAKEKRAGILKDRELPEQPLLQLLMEKDYERAFPFVLPVLEEYYLEQHKKHEKNISIYEKIWNSVTDNEWIQFFDLIEWNFDGKTGKEIWKDNEELVRKLCIEYELEYSDKILEQIVGKLRLKINEKDFLKRVISVSDIENLFLMLFYESQGKSRKRIKPGNLPVLISENDYGRRFLYNANLTPLRGREAEMKYLHDFCDAPGYLKWTAIYGQGGSGKTRLAFDFCKEMEKEGWFPQLPCHTRTWFKYNGLNIIKSPANILICMDYVKYNIDDIEEFIRMLNEMDHYSGNKIRIILIERNMEDFEDLIQEESEIKEYLYLSEKDKETGHYEFIHLKEMEETAIRLIIRDYINGYQKQLMLDKKLSDEDENKMIEVLLNIDPEEKRPLYALFIADAWCAGEPLDKWDRSTAHQYILGKELRRIDRAVKDSGLSDREKSTYGDAIKYALTLATYVESITAEEIYDLAEKGFDVNRNDLKWILEKADYLSKGGQNIISIEPDIVGEYWCLQMLARFDEKAVKLFFNFLFNNYLFDTLNFSNKIYNDNRDIMAGFPWVENLERITYPDNLTYVRKNAFKGYSFVKNVILHNHVLRIDAGAFRECKNLEKMNFPASLETIGRSAFAGCSSLTSVLPSDKRGKEPSILTIQDNAFKGCTSLTEIIIPESVDSIGYSVFEGCKKLEEIIIPRKINSIESCTFAGCSDLERVEFAYRTQENRIILHDKAFWRCKKLSVIQGGERITHIGGKAFGCCASLHKLPFMSKLRGIEEGAFLNCTGLTEADLSDCEIPVLPDQIFYNCDHLETVCLPERLRKIGKEAFFDCRHLLKIKIPDGVKKIGSYAFGNCISLRKLELPDSDVRVMDHAISGCRDITFSAIKNIPDKEFCGFTFSAITEKEIDFLTSYAEKESVEVPDSVIQIGERAFFRQKCLVQIQIPPSVKSIGSEAFKLCDSLIKVNANPNSISEIGQGAFERCTSLKHYSGRLKVDHIEDYVFKDCTALKRVFIASALRSIGQYAFAGCTNLKIIFRGKGILSYSIGLNAFLNCEQMSYPVNLSYIKKGRIHPGKFELYGFTFRKIGVRELEFVSNYWNQENVIIPETCIRFKGNLFKNNRTIKTIQVPQSIKVLPQRAFAGCYELVRISLPQNLKSLPAEIFMDCKSLKQFVFDGFADNTIPDDMTIGKKAFSGCASLKEIYLPGNMKVIAESTFFSCLSLQKVDLPQELLHIKKSAFQSCTALRTVSIPNSLSKIDYCAFMECKSLRRVKDFESCQVQVLSNDIFKGCTSLETVLLPENLHEIGAGVFYSCHSLKKIDLPMPLEKIGMAAFEECYKLEKVKIPPKVTKIEKFTFKYCSSLQQVEHYHRIEKIDISAFYNCSSLQWFQMPKRVTQIGISAFAFCNSYEKAEIPDTVCELSSGMFEGCVSLKKVTLPEHVEKIPSNCFKGCRNLVDINLPAGLKEIGAGAFRNCYSYDPLVLPDELVIIQPSAFRFCDKMTEITLPESINNIPVSAFGGCSSLRKIEFAAVEQVDNYAFSNCSNLREIPIQNIERRIGIAAFQDCISLNGIYFSDTIVTIDSAAFRGCSGIEQLTLPSSIVKIYGGVFRENTSLKEVCLPESVEIIKKSAFRDCIKLETVEIKSEKIEIEKNAFRGCETLFDLIIPAESLVHRSAFIDCPMKDCVEIQNDIKIIDDEE